MMLADMTARDNELYDYALHGFAREGIPYNLLVTPNGPTIEFPTLITPGVIKDALSDAGNVASEL